MITVNHTENSKDAPRHSHTWRGNDGEARAAVDIGATWLAFDDPAGARALAAECLKAADAMDALPPAPEGGQP